MLLAENVTNRTQHDKGYLYKEAYPVQRLSLARTGSTDRGQSSLNLRYLNAFNNTGLPST